MRTAVNSTITVSLIAVAAIFQMGCSAIGYGIGSAIDSRHGAKGEIPESKWTTLNANQPVQVFRDSGSFITGHCYGVTELTDDDYKNRYESWRKSDSTRSAVPAPGDSVILNLEAGGVQTGRLMGYDKEFPEKTHVRSGRPSDRRLALAYGQRPEGVLLVKKSESAEVLRFSTKSVSRISGVSGEGLSGSALTEMIVNNRLPTLPALVVRSDSQVWNIPVDRINSVVVTGERGHARWVGLGIGALADVALIALIASGGWGWDTGPEGLHGI